MQNVSGKSEKKSKKTGIIIVLPLEEIQILPIILKDLARSFHLRGPLMSTSGLTEKEIQSIKSEDAAVRRQAVERFLSEEMSDDTAKLICSMISDPDTGVRDTVSLALIYNANNKIAEYIVEYIASPEISIRNFVGEVLLKRGTSSIAAMLSFIPKGDDDDKKFLVDILGLIGSNEPADAIVKLLNEIQNENVILACIEALGNIEATNYLDEIISFYDKSELYRPTIVDAVGKMGDEKALEFVKSHYESSDDLTKFSMLEILGRIGDESTFFFLQSELSNIQPPLTWAAVSSIKSLKEKFSLDIPYEESIKHAILNTLLYSEITYQKNASYLLEFFKDKEIYDACYKIYGFDPEIDDNIKSNFYSNKKVFYTEVIGHLKLNAVNLKPLLEMTLEFVNSAPGDVFNFLSKMETHNLCTSLTDLLSHSDEEIRRIVTELIFSIDVSSAFVFIDIMSCDNNVWNRLRLIEILEGINSEESTEALKNLANDDDEMVQERALIVLNQRGC